MTGRKHMLLIAVLTALVAVPGCGGGGKSDTPSKQEQAQLSAAQAAADIQLFCLRSTLKSTGTDLQNTGFMNATKSVGDLAAAQRQYPDVTVPFTQRQPKVPMSRVVKDTLQTLKTKCGSDGKLLAVRLQHGS